LRKCKCINQITKLSFPNIKINPIKPILIRDTFLIKIVLLKGNLVDRKSITVDTMSDIVLDNVNSVVNKPNTLLDNVYTERNKFNAEYIYPNIDCNYLNTDNDNFEMV